MLRFIEVQLLLDGQDGFIKHVPLQLSIVSVNLSSLQVKQQVLVEDRLNQGCLRAQQQNFKQ